MKNTQNKRITILIIIMIAAITGIVLASLFSADSQTMVSGLDFEELLNPQGSSKESGIEKPEDQGFDLVYSAWKEGDWDIYAMDEASGQETRIVNSSSYDLNPQISPDGSKMVFVSGRDGDAEIFLLDLNSFMLRKLTDNDASDWDPDFSPKGDQIVYKSNIDDGYGDIWIMDSNGQNKQNVTPGRDQTEEWDPTFSHSNDQIFFVSRLGADSNSDEIFRLDLNGGALGRLTNNSVPDWYPDVHPFEEKIMFISKDGAADTQRGDDIYTMDFNGIDRTKLISRRSDDDDPAFSPDGSQIVFINNDTGYYDMFMAYSDGTDIRQVTSDLYDELCPIFAR